MVRFVEHLLVIGNGLLGSNLVTEGKKQYNVASTFYQEPKDIEGEQFKLDVREKQEINEVFSNVNPDIVIDTAAMHNVDKCEEDPQQSKAVNVKGTRHVVDACEKFACKLVYISTDYVFDGKKDSPYSEADDPNPLNVYGKHKLIAEQAVLKNGENVVVRPSVIYGWDPVKLNFVTWALQELKKGKEIEIVDDQYSNPTYANDLAKMILELLENDASGLYHSTGSKCLNRYEFTLLIADVFELDLNLVSPIKTSALGQLAERPKKCCLSTSKFENVVDRTPLPPKNGLKKMIKKKSE